MEKQLSVLIVEDDADARANMEDILNDAGYRTQSAGDGLRAMDLFQRGAFDIALLDFRLPGLDGGNLYRQIHSLQPDTTTILTTAYPSEPGVRKACQAGLKHVLHKPVDVVQLLSLLERVGSDEPPHAN